MTNPETEPISKIMYSFTFITTVYFILKYYTCDKVGSKDEIKDKFAKSRKTNMVFSLIYVIFISIITAMFNIKNANIICQNTSKGGAAAWYSLLPMLLIFGMIMTLLIIMPSWKQPFSNTLGYGIVSLPWINIDGSVDKLLHNERSKLLTKIYDDKSLLINEMTPENFYEFMVKMSQDLGSSTFMLNKQFPGETTHPGVILYNAVILKDMVSQWCWYILTGILIILITSNIIMDINCDSSSGIMAGYNKLAEKDFDKVNKLISKESKKSEKNKKA